MKFVSGDVVKCVDFTSESGRRLALGPNLFSVVAYSEDDHSILVVDRIFNSICDRERTSAYASRFVHYCPPLENDEYEEAIMAQEMILAQTSN